MTNRIGYRDGDTPDENDFADAFDHSATTNYVRETSGSYTLNSGTPSLDTEEFVRASINGVPVESDPVNGVSLTDNATNFVFLRYDTADVAGYENGTDDHFYVDTSNSPEGGTVESLLVYIVDTADDEVYEPNRYPAPQTKGSRTNDRNWRWRVFKAGGRWHALGPPDESGTSGTDPATVLQYALDRGSTWLVSSVLSDDPITSTVEWTSTDFRGPGARGSGNIYVDTDQADPGFKKVGQGEIRDCRFKGDPGGSRGAGDLLWVEDLGRGSLVENVTLSYTAGNGMVVAGCQQSTFRAITSEACGDPASDTWHIYLTDHPTHSGGLATNANNWIGLHRHGSPTTDGGWIAMRDDQQSGGDTPRTQYFYGLNCENGPTDNSTPLIEVTDRDHGFFGGRIGNIDDASDIFKVPSGASRAQSVLIMGLRVIAESGGAGPTNFWNANGKAAASPTIVGCPRIDVSGEGVILDNYGNSNESLVIANTDFSNTSPICDVDAGQDAGNPVILNGVGGSGTIDVQGARLSVSNVPEASWASKSADFGPRLISDDGSFNPAQFTGSTSGGAGLATVSFSGDFELKDGTVTAYCDRGGGVIVQGASLDDTSANGDLDTARAHVVNVSDGTDAADGTTVNFVIHPRAP